MGVSRPLRVALLGGGKMAMEHAKALASLGDVAQLVAVADPSVPVEELQQRFGSQVHGFADPDELLERMEPDVVHVVTPPNTHAELARKALEHGAHLYVEKPFAQSVSDAKELLNLAERRDLLVCAAHQVRFQQSGQDLLDQIGQIGKVAHVESYFSFRPVRRRADGKRMSASEQLLDILPHPVYLLLSAFGEAREVEVKNVELPSEGEVRATLSVNGSIAVLVVTLNGRPIESYLRIVGTNGSVVADFVVGGVTRLIGPGTSAISVVLKPFRTAFQTVFGSSIALARMILKRHKSYPGLSELLARFYDSIRNSSSPPIAVSEIVQTVAICEEVSKQLLDADELMQRTALTSLEQEENKLVPANSGKVLVTGGTGFLGREFVRQLRGKGYFVRVITRSMPSPKERLPGVEYVVGNLAGELGDEVFSDIDMLVHLAAETSGGKVEHRRNTVLATENLRNWSEIFNIPKIVSISSTAVMDQAGNGVLTESTPIDLSSADRGPYVESKAHAEMVLRQLDDDSGNRVKTIRLGPLVDFADFSPPGRLGREAGPLFVAVGGRREALSVCDVKTAANVICHYVENFEQTPRILNLVEAPAPCRSELIDRLRKRRPDLKVVWMPWFVLRPMSVALRFMFKILRPRDPALDVYSAFAGQKFDTSLAAEMIAKADDRQEIAASAASRNAENTTS